MAGITLDQAQTQLNNWLAAIERISVGQSYSITTGEGSRTLTRADLGDAQKQVEYWDRQVKRLTRGGIRVRGVTISRG
jgi:hypothetical protein